MPIRIIHFSDFHLDGEHVEEAETLLHYMIEAIKKNNLNPHLLVFTGDMLCQGGHGFNSIEEGFSAFEKNVIEPVCTALKLPKERFVFVPGNHDICRDADDSIMEMGLESRLQKEEGVANLLHDSKIGNYTQRITAVKEFEKRYYSSIMGDNYRYDRFASSFKLDIDGVKVGVVGLNTIWRCGADDENKIVLGLCQINESAPFVDSCDLKIAMTHYRYDKLKEFERDDFKKSIANNFDILFTGHTHSNHLEFAYQDNGNAFLDVNTAGSLTTNEFTEDESHKNAFQYVTYYPNDHVEAEVYRQIRGQFFEKDMNFGKGGLMNRPLPTMEDIKKYAEAEQVEIRNTKDTYLKAKMLPFTRIQDFPKEGSRFQEAFVTNDKIEEIKENLLDENIRTIRFMALSGMGKTRIVLDTFSPKENVFYAPICECENGLYFILGQVEEGIIIVDNCPNNKATSIRKILSESGRNFRLITIHNVLTNSEEKVDGALLTLSYTDGQDIIKKMLVDDPLFKDKPDLMGNISVRCGNIPYMAILLMDAYRKNHNLHIEDRETVLAALLDQKDLSEDSKKVLNAISLFDPVGYDKTVRDEYEFVTHNRNIHHITQSQDIVDTLFGDTIHEYRRRQLIEHDGLCLRLRPQPLAEWLAEDWFGKYGDDFESLLTEIQQQESNLAKRLHRALNNRFKRLKDSPYASDLVERLNNIVDGVFHKEDLAYSESGSQLFSSMGQVNPVAVGRNMYSLVSNQSIEWLREHIDGHVRSNWRWALNSIAHDADAFAYAAKVYACLSLAENESFSNNSTGQFLQLFHIVLSGTNASLDERIRVLRELGGDTRYSHQVMKAIQSAFSVNSVVRSISGDEKDVDGEVTEFKPTYADVISYWRSCAELLIQVVDNHPAYRNEVREWLPRQILDLCTYHGEDILADLIRYFSDNDTDWLEMYEGMLRYTNSKHASVQMKDKLQDIILKLKPKEFNNRLKGTYGEVLMDYRSSYDEREKLIESAMQPLAEEFLRERLYNSQTLGTLMMDSDFLNYYFVRQLAKLIEENDLSQEVLYAVWQAVQKQPVDFESRFVYLLMSYLNDETYIVGLENLCFNAGYYRLSASLLGILEKENILLFDSVVKRFHSGMYDESCVNNYLYRYRYHTYSNIFDLFHKLQIEISNECAYGYFMNHLAYAQISEIENCEKLDDYYEILTSYPYESIENYQLTHEVIGSVERVLKERESPKLAFKIHRVAVDALSNDLRPNNPFEDLYFSILPKYQDVVLDDLLETIADEKNFYFYFNMRLHLGSGFHTGKGPLFQCDTEKLKKKCMQYPSIMPRRMANMCPVYDEEGTKNGTFSTFFMWLCDEFGDQTEMLGELGANLNTGSWTGITSMADIASAKLPHFEYLLHHQKANVRLWAEQEINSLRKEIEYESDSENYERVTSGY